MRQFALPVLIERADHFLKEVGSHGVVARGDINVLSFCLTQALIPSWIRALTRSLGNPNTLIGSCDVLDEFPRSVIGMTVIHKQLPIIERLSEYAVKPFSQKGKGIQVRQANGNQRPHSQERNRSQGTF
jgi:hypothetical protein